MSCVVPTTCASLRGFTHGASVYLHSGDCDGYTMNVTQMKEAIQSACKDTTFILSAHLRGEARASGWPEHIVRSVHARYGKEGFSTHIHPEHREEALDLEYGRPGLRPSAAMRRAGNRTKEAEHFLMKRTAYHLGGKK